MLLLLSLLSLCAGALSSYCGESAIPFTFQSLRSGHPVLGCARPRCFGWNSNGTRAGDTAQFYRINGKEDGYLRRSDQLLHAPVGRSDYVAQTAHCSDNYRSNGCKKGEWVGGIAPQSDAHRKDMQVKCCSYSPLSDSEDRGIAPISQGQVFIGGEVMENDQLTAFDYISSITKKAYDNGTIVYSVEVRRMPCFDAEIQPVLPDSEQSPSLDGDAHVQNKVIPVQKVQTPAPRQAPKQNRPVSQPNRQLPQQPRQPQQNAAPTVPLRQPTQPYGQLVQNSYGNAPSNVQASAPSQVGPPPQGGLPTIEQSMTEMFQRLSPQAILANSPFAPQQGVPAQSTLQERPQPRPMNHLNQPRPPTAPTGYRPIPQQVHPVAGGYQQNNIRQPVAYPANQPALQQAQQGNHQPQAQAQATHPSQMGTAQPPIQMTPMPTLPPLSLPNLEDLPKIEIPSVEDVENVIPPVQRAILTNIARFFGVL